MKIRKYLCLIYIILSQTLYSKDITPFEYNDRAYESYKNDPSNALYYAEKSIDANRELEDWKEQVRSLYIKALSYDTLGDRESLREALDSADEILKSNNYNYIDGEYYVFYARKLLEEEENDFLKEFLSLKKVISNLDDKSIVKFNILKFMNSVKLNSGVDLDKLEQTLSLSKSLNIPELISEVYIVYGDYFLNSDKNRASSYYLKATEDGASYYAGIGYLKLGETNNNINYLREALIISEIVDSYDLKVKTLTKLAELYKKRSMFKDLAYTLESLNYLTTTHNKFLILQNMKIEKFGFEKETLLIQLEKNNNIISIMVITLISLGVAVLFLTVMLIIQSYRLRGYNI